MKQKTKTKTSNFFKIIFFIILSAVVLFPIFYTVSNSFMGEKEVLSAYSGVIESDMKASMHLFPKHFTMESYEKVLIDTSEYLLKFWKSIVMCIAIVVGQVVIGGTCGFAFAKYRFKGWKIAYILFITFLLLPIQITLVPNYIVLNKLHLIGTWWALILPSIFSPFAVFLMTIIFNNIPNDMIEAGKLDGANTLEILFRIMIPVAKPGVASLIVLVFVDNWNMVEQPISFLDKISQYPLSVFLASVTNENFALQFVCGVISLIPVTLLFLFYNEELVEGISVSVAK